jgi:hypothetical protein
LANIVKLLALGAIGYAVTQRLRKNHNGQNAAFSRDHSGDASMPVRDAGPENMRDKPTAAWSSVDEASDQSFPASDPPANY